MKKDRRTFIKQLSSLSLLAAIEPRSLMASDRKQPNNSQMPLWKGFNLLNKFMHYHQTPFDEADFKIIADWGFNFVRLPLSYWCWSSEDEWYKVDEKILKEIDAAVELGKKHGIHVNINFHRVPGYCINKDDNMPLHSDLFEDEAPLDACAYHWELFAERYKSYTNAEVSFNLINEAPSIEAEKYDKVARRLISAIREIDPKRLIFVDGKDIGGSPLMTITDIPDIIQSGRGYQPFLLTHLRASWAESWSPIKEYPIEKVTWPLDYDGKLYDKAFLQESSVLPWKPWIEAGGRVHIGEMGCHNFTPHDTAIAWLDDLLDVFDEQGWGWSLWNLSGSFGVLDSNRKDVEYEDYKGRKLDRKMLDVLIKHL